MVETNDIEYSISLVETQRTKKWKKTKTSCFHSWLIVNCNLFCPLMARQSMLACQRCKMANSGTSQSSVLLGIINTSERCHLELDACFMQLGWPNFSPTIFLACWGDGGAETIKMLLNNSLNSNLVKYKVDAFSFLPAPNSPRPD